MKKSCNWAGKWSIIVKYLAMLPASLWAKFLVMPRIWHQVALLCRKSAASSFTVFMQKLSAQSVSDHPHNLWVTIGHIERGKKMQIFSVILTLPWLKLSSVTGAKGHLKIIVQAKIGQEPEDNRHSAMGFTSSFRTHLGPLSLLSQTSYLFLTRCYLDTAAFLPLSTPFLLL